MAVTNEEFAKRTQSVRTKLYKTALTYLGSESLALDAVDEAVYGTYLWDPQYKGLDDYVWQCCFQNIRR